MTVLVEVITGLPGPAGPQGPQGPPGLDGSRGPGFFVSSVDPDDPTFDAPTHIAGFPSGGLITGDSVMGPSGEVWPYTAE